MTSPIKPPGSGPDAIASAIDELSRNAEGTSAEGASANAESTNEATRTSQAETSSASQVGQAKALSPTLKAALQEVREGALSKESFVDKLVEEAMHSGIAERMPETMRADLASFLKEQFEQDPNLVRLLGEATRPDES